MLKAYGVMDAEHPPKHGLRVWVEGKPETLDPGPLFCTNGDECGCDRSQSLVSQGLRASRGVGFRA